MINEKLLFAAVICFSIFLSLTVNATMTDGNYIMTAWDTTGSGETATDGNYGIALASAGETATAKNIADTNYNAGIGFLGNVFIALAAFVSPIVPPAVSTVLMILPVQVGTNIPQILLVIGVCLMLFYFFIRKRMKNSTKEEGVENG